MFSETMASTDESSRCQNPEQQYYHSHHRVNLISHTFITICMCTNNHRVFPLLWQSILLYTVFINSVKVNKSLPGKRSRLPLQFQEKNVGLRDHYAICVFHFQILNKSTNIHETWCEH
jgi:hypothetical protein